MRADFIRSVGSLAKDLVIFVCLLLRSEDVLAAENLFLRKQLALYRERGVKPRPTDPAMRLTMTLLSKRFDWRNALIVVQPETLVRWHRDCFRRIWWKKSQAGRKLIPVELRQVIRRMASENPLWGEERIANEILVKFRTRLSPRTVRKYMPLRRPRQPHRGQSWKAFLRNHSREIIACDFCTVVTANFRVLYVLVIMEHTTRRLLYTNVTANPTAAWTIQQFRDALPFDHSYRFLVRDRDCIFSERFDTAIKQLGIASVRTPPRTPQANGLCERFIGTLRRECLDHLIPLTHRQLRANVLEFQDYYNASRPHSSLGPAIPDHTGRQIQLVNSSSRTTIGKIRSKPVLGGLHHDYRSLAA